MKPEEMKSHIKADQKEFDELLDKNEEVEGKLEDMKEEDKDALKKLSSDVAARIIEKLAAPAYQEGTGPQDILTGLKMTLDETKHKIPDVGYNQSGQKFDINKKGTAGFLADTARRAREAMRR